MVPCDSWCRVTIHVELSTESLFPMSTGIHHSIFTCLDPVKGKADISFSKVWDVTVHAYDQILDFDGIISLSSL